MFVDPSVALGCLLGVNSATTSEVRKLNNEVAALRRELNGTAQPPPPEPTRAEIEAWMASPEGQKVAAGAKRRFDTFAFWFIAILGTLVFLGWLVGQ